MIDGGRKQLIISLLPLQFHIERGGRENGKNATASRKNRSNGVADQFMRSFRRGQMQGDVFLQSRQGNVRLVKRRSAVRICKQLTIFRICLQIFICMTGLLDTSGKAGHNSGGPEGMSKCQISTARFYSSLPRIKLFKLCRQSHIHL